MHHRLPPLLDPALSHWLPAPQRDWSCDGSELRLQPAAPDGTLRNHNHLIEMDLDSWREPFLNPDGSPNKYPRALKDFPRRGRIGLQDHGRPVRFRNLRVKPL